MPSLIVITLQKPKTSLRGGLRRIFHEVDSGVFVGSLPARRLPELWSAICENSKAAILVKQSKNELGYEIKIHGKPNREIVDNFGIPLVSYR